MATSIQLVILTIIVICGVWLYIRLGLHNLYRGADRSINRRREIPVEDYDGFVDGGE